MSINSSNKKNEILLEMNFQEMPTNSFVESSFWNFDSLFQPQQHPARDAHDTFFVTNPKYSKVEKKTRKAILNGLNTSFS